MRGIVSRGAGVMGFVTGGGVDALTERRRVAALQMMRGLLRILGGLKFVMLENLRLQRD